MIVETCIKKKVQWPNISLMIRIVSCKLELMFSLSRFDVICRDYATGKCDYCWSVTELDIGSNEVKKGQQPVNQQLKIFHGMVYTLNHSSNQG